jgi:hypothetical protein
MMRKIGIIAVRVHMALGRSASSLVLAMMALPSRWAVGSWTSGAYLSTGLTTPQPQLMVKWFVEDDEAL